MKAAPAGPVLRLAFVAACLPPLSPAAVAGTAYVTDELVLNVYSQENSEGKRLATLRSGAVLEAVTANGESTQVRLPDGRTGWVKTSYLTTHEPAIVRLKELQDELERRKVAPPRVADARADAGAAQAGAAQAAARAEIERLTRELAAVKERRDEPHATAAVVSGSEAPVSALRGPVGAFVYKSAPMLAAVGVGASVGYWFGYASLARRVRAKFGGIKVY